MIALTADATAVLSRSYRYHLNVQSWRDGQLLADDVPVSAATEDSDRSLRVPEKVTFTVPRLDRGRSWSPVSDDHPLAANGQRLVVQVGIGLAGGLIEWIQRGWYLIQDAAVDGDTITVTAVGLLALVAEARFVSPFQPTGTLASTVRGLVEPALTVEVSSSLTDRAVPSGINFDEDRLAAVLDLLDAWPADAYVTPAGTLAVVPDVTSTTPVLTLTNGTGGTIIEATGSSTREGVATVVVARGTASDGGQVQGVAYDNTNNGRFNPLPVPHFFSSPLLTTVVEAQAAAATILARLTRANAVEFAVQMVPNPALQLGDTVSVTTDDYTALLCSVEALSLPLTAAGGHQTLKVRAL